MAKLQMAMFAPKSEWIPPLELPDLTSAKKIAIDVETRDPNLKKHGPGWPTGDGEVVGYAIAVDDWSGYIPIRHYGGGNLDEKQVNKWLKKVFECPADKIMHNAQYDLGWIKRMGFDVKGRIIDTMVVASLLDENRFSYSLNALAYEHLNKVKSEKGLVEAAREFGVDPKAEMWKMPAMYVGPYAEGDAELTLELWNYFSVQLGKENLWSVANLELDLLPCLVDMTMRGVRVNTNRVERTRDSLLKREREVMKEIKRLSGSDVEIWAAQSLSKAFDKVGIHYPRTEKGAPSFTKLFLQEHQHPLAQLVTQARNLNKTSGTFINTIMKHCHADGRIHSHINQIRSDDGGTVSGILVHYAHVYGKTRGVPLEGAAEFVKAYNDDPETDFHSLVAEMANIPRKQAKTINLGLIYGMGVNKMSEQLDISVEEAKGLVKQYHNRVPFVKGLMTGVMNRLNEKSSGGSLTSLLGRKCRFNLWEPDTFAMHKAMPYREAVDEYGPTTRLKRAYTYKALNRLIQASAADMTKKAMVDLYKQGILPMLQIHDELAMSVKNVEEAKVVAGVMESAVPLEVPSKCDIEIGPSWGEAK